MRIIGDLHIHSRYSRATSSRLTPPGLERWARIKGLQLLGSGDCTHPQWLRELRENLDDCENGFYTLKKKIRKQFDSGPGLAEALPLPFDETAQELRFVLTGEISTIYKKGDKTRKVHHLVILPGFKAAAAFQLKLERIGNIHSDGRPILGLDSRELLALLLETDERAILVPAHIWTPWFSVLGAKSGFDSIEECYGDLASCIPAIETGLSSNPPMNWALSSLDRFSIISNSDAHSPDKLGREATIFEMDLSRGFSYDSFKEALKGSGILGTVEFFPQEGKYHYDGHRKCNICLGPEEAAEHDNICPECGKPLTRGVMGRVQELADRPVDETAACPKKGRANCKPYYSLIPLKEILGELLGTGGTSKKAEAAYKTLIEKAGSEFSILMDMEPKKIEALSCPGLSAELLAKAIGRMRRGEVTISAGYDGEYGVIRTFAPEELRQIQNGLFETKPVVKKKPVQKKQKPEKKPLSKVKKNFTDQNVKTDEIQNSPGVRTFSLDKDQEAAVSSASRETLIIAGPGTGKTAVMAAKIIRLIGEGIDPASILALSFTVKAAAELRDRILRVTEAPHVSTFHSFCVSVLREQYLAAGLPENFEILPENERKYLLERTCDESGIPLKDPSGWNSRRLGDYIDMRKRYLLLPGESAKEISSILPKGLNSFMEERIRTEEDYSVPESLYAQYRRQLRSLGYVDYDGLISGTVRLLAQRKDILDIYRLRFQHIFVDEYQDINFAQYALIRLLVPSGNHSPSLSVIGDPNQAIYGFRGSDKTFIDRFLIDYPEARCFELRKSFRCAGPIIEAAGKLTHTSLEGVKKNAADSMNSAAVSLFRREYVSDKSEARSIARTIASLVGGTSFFALDSNIADGEDSNVSPGDCAILVRAHAMTDIIVKALEDNGIPFVISDTSAWWEEEPVNHLVGFLREHNPVTNQDKSAAFPVSAEEEIRGAWEILKAGGSVSHGKSSNNDISEAIETLVNLANLFGSVPALLDSLSSENGIPAVRQDGVRVMTIHAAKGLEFDHVFVPGLEEGILPFTLYGEGADIEEEKRLLYVAMTRARSFLWLSHARSRNFRGRILKAPPSRFLAELGSLVPLVKEKSIRQRDAQMTLF